MPTRRYLMALACALGCLASCDDAAWLKQDVLARARSLRADGALSQAETLLQAEYPRLSATERAHAHGLLGRLALAQGKTSHARAELNLGMRQQRALGKVAEALADGFALTFLEAEVAHDLSRSDAVLDELATFARDNAEDRAALAHHRALVAYKGDEPRRALALLGQARAESISAIPAALARAIRTLHGSVLASLGRFADARAVATELVALSTALGPCERSDAYANRGWFALLSQLAASPFAAQAPKAAHDDFVLAQTAAEACVDPRRLGHAAINLALSWLVERSDVTAAEAALARFDALRLDGEPDLQAWALQTRGRLRLTQERWDEAREAFTRELALAEAAGSDGWAYRALLGLGREQLGRGRYDAALQSFQRAEQRVTRLAALAPLSAGHDAFYAQREDAALGVVQSLVALARIDEAEAAARTALSLSTAQASIASRADTLTAPQHERLRANMQKYRTLRDALDRESRDDWRLSSRALARVAEQRTSQQAALYRALDAGHAILTPFTAHEPLRSLALDAVRLTLFPTLTQAGSGHWLLFVRDTNGVRLLKTTMSADRATLVRELGAFLQAKASAARRVELALHRTFPLPDLHASAIDGHAWNTRAQVVYAEGLSTAKASLTPSARALLVLDPTHTLANVEQEAGSVTRAWQKSGLEVEVRTAEQATRSQLLSDLANVQHLHFAGHARDDGEAFVGPSLALARGESLSAFDVLSLERAPAQVVLSACRAGSSESATLSLARAFLAQGSQEVMAATRAVGDADTTRLMSALYAELPSAGSLAEAFRRAVGKLEQHPDSTDWAAFRIFVR